MIKHWTREEEETLWNLKMQGKRLADIAEILGRSDEAVRTRSKRLNAQKGVVSKTGGNYSWTQPEIEILYKELDFDELEKELPGKTRRAIMSKCEKLGISKRYPGTHSGTGTMDPNKDTTLYLVDFGEYKKIGICQVSVRERLKQDGIYILLDQVDGMDLADAISTEREILQNMRTHRVVGDVRRGSSECFNYPCASLEDLI